MAGPPLAYRDFRLGLDTKDAPYLLDEGLGALPARDLSNVQATTAGAIVKRNGLVTFASPAAAFTSLFASEATPTNVLIGASGTKLQSVTTGGAVADIKTGLTAGLRWEFASAPVVSARGPVYGMNGTDTPQFWTGAAAGTATADWTSASGGVAVPNGKYLIGGDPGGSPRLFVAGVAATPSTVYFSAIADPTNWDPASLTGAGSIQFDPNDGQAITGLGKVGPYILVCKPRKLWVLVDPGSATYRKLSDNVGCVAHRSIASGPNGTYFLAEDRGVYLTNGSKVEPISDKIQPTVDLSASKRANAVGACMNAHYYLSLSSDGSGGNDYTLDFDETLQSWWKHSFGSNQFAIWHPTGTAQLYSAKSTAAIVDQCFASGVNVDNGSPFAWVWRGPWQSPSFYRRRLFPTPQYRKRFRQVRFDGSGTVDFSLAMNFATVETLMQASLFTFPTTTWGGTGTWGVDGIWGDAPPISREKYFPSKVANAFSLVFGATSSTADSVLSYTLYLVDRSDSQS